ncbi:hypothetical protein NQZ68_022472 [Dissostichus eleginoides]|nr:hypothetical protein NQZ68_022472 [Dissostichus eleginoides]
MSVGIGRLNPAFGSSRSASSAYQQSDDRFARQDRYGPPPEFPLASPCPGIVHHLSGPIARAHAPPPRQCGRDGPVVRPAPRGRDPTSAGARRPSLSLRHGVLNAPSDSRALAPGTGGPVPPPGGREGTASTLSTAPGGGEVWAEGAVKHAAEVASHLAPSLSKPTQSRSRRTAAEEMRPAGASQRRGEVPRGDPPTPSGSSLFARRY